jgi:mycothiol synthase
MDLPNGYALRTPTWDDLEPAAEVLAADDLDDAGQVVLDSGFLRGQWERSGFDLTTDAWVAVDAAGAVVGYGQVMRDGDDVVDSWGVVHPAQRGRGIGSALLGRIEARAIGLLAGVHGARIRHSVNAGDEAAAAMLRSRGLHLVRHFWHMSIELSPAVVAGPAPSGIAITSLRPQDDLREVHAVLDEAFADHWGYVPETFEHWAGDWTQGSDYDPSLWRLAWEHRRLVGALTAVVRGDQGWVTLLGIRREARGRGIGGALLQRAFEAFATRRIRAVVLVVDAANSTGATALYERVGMRVVKRFDVWERALDPSAVDAAAPADVRNRWC